ncbi:MAG: SHOCT domain-containing protein [Xanthomonadales bacterium]|jgi:putative membrane protein|nr:SHOCT domain-containing protein [Xanthomonadales bacterium]
MGGFGLPGLGMILFWGLIVLIAVGLVRLVARDRPDAGKGPREILDERLARGEIDEAEHERKRHLLG